MAPYANELWRFCFISFAYVQPAGLFLLIDRIALDTTHFANLYRAMWKRLEEGRESKGGTSSNDFLERLQDKDGKCPETSTDVALKPAHLPRMVNIRDPLSENVASEADHSERQL